MALPDLTERPCPFTFQHASLLVIFPDVSNDITHKMLTLNEGRALRPNQSCSAFQAPWSCTLCLIAITYTSP